MKSVTHDPARRPLSSRTFLDSLEELEARLEAQMAGPLNMDDDTCVYYLCTTRCSGTKCTALGEL